jgi:hypothetical protein
VTHYERHAKLLAAGLYTLAGFVDAPARSDRFALSASSRESQDA